MGAFEFETNNNMSARSCGCGCNCNGNNNCDHGEACIIAQKIFDQCRVQKCCSPDLLGPARAACHGMGGCDMVCEGEIIVPPVNAASVTMHNTELSRIDILRKSPSSLQNGCWDLELRFVFDYTLEFRRADGCPICCTDASNAYTMKVSLYGSTEADVTSVTDLYDCCGNSHGGPFVIAEGKAVGLAAELRYSGCRPSNCGCNCSCDCDCCDCSCNCGCNCSCNNGDSSMGSPIAVNVTIGLFAIIKLFRTVNMLVESLGRCVPEECYTPSNNGDPCKNFDAYPFPLDLFSPCAQPKSCCAFGDGYGSNQGNCVDHKGDSCDTDNACNTNHNNNGCTNCNHKYHR